MLRSAAGLVCLLAVAVLALTAAAASVDVLAKLGQQVDELLRRGDAALRGRDAPSALTAFQQAEQLDASNLGVLQGLAMTYSQLGEHARAVEYWVQVSVFSPKPRPEIFYNAALGYLNMGNIRQAIDFFTKCGETFRPALLKLASIYRDDEEPEKVISLLQRAIDLDPNSPDAYAYMGDTLNNLKLFGRAIAFYTEGLQRAGPRAPPPNVVQTLTSIGDAHCNLKRCDLGSEFYSKALAVGRQHRLPASMTASAVVGSFFARQEMGSFRGFELAEEQVVALALSSISEVPGGGGGAMNGGVALVSPYRLLFLQRPEASLAVARSWSRALAQIELRAASLPGPGPGPGADGNTAAPGAVQVLPRPSSCQPTTLHIGYISRRFHDYPGTQLMLDVFKAHNRSAVCVTAFAHAPDEAGSDYRRIVAQTSDAFVDVSTSPTREAAAQIQARGVDVLVDYDGLHDYNSIKLLARRPAKVIVSWLGFAGVLGQGAGLAEALAREGASSAPAAAAAAIDFLVADRFVLPPDLAPARSSAQARGEKLLLLPFYQPQSLSAADGEREPLQQQQLQWGAGREQARLALLREFLVTGGDEADPPPLPSASRAKEEEEEYEAAAAARAMALAASGRWVLSFNRMSKMTPGLLHGLFNLLRATPDARLLLLAESPAATALARLHAAMHGIDPGRVLLFRRLPKASYKRLLRLGDLFIDTRNYGSHTVASDAMIQGVPVLTLPGVSFASRVALSINTHAGQQHTLVVAEEKGWERRALQLLHSPPSRTLQASSRRVAAASRGRCLGNSPVFARNMERILQAAATLPLPTTTKYHVFAPKSTDACSST